MKSDDIKISVQVKCPFCKKEYVIKNVPRIRYFAWKDGRGHIQDLLPELSADDREALITGVCSDCWNNMFADHG